MHYWRIFNGIDSNFNFRILMFSKIFKNRARTVQKWTPDAPPNHSSLAFFYYVSILSKWNRICKRKREHVRQTGTSQLRNVGQQTAKYKLERRQQRPGRNDRVGKPSCAGSCAGPSADSCASLCTETRTGTRPRPAGFLMRSCMGRRQEPTIRLSSHDDVFGFPDGCANIKIM